MNCSSSSFGSVWAACSAQENEKRSLQELNRQSKRAQEDIVDSLRQWEQTRAAAALHYGDGSGMIVMETEQSPLDMILKGNKGSEADIDVDEIKDAGEEGEDDDEEDEDFDPVFLCHGKDGILGGEGIGGMHSWTDITPRHSRARRSDIHMELSDS